MMRRKLFLFSCLLLHLQCTAQPDIRASAYPSRIVVGDPVTLTLTARNIRPGAALLWPVLPDSLGVLQVIERKKIDTARTGSGISYTQKITLSGYDSAVGTIPALSFTYSDGSGAMAIGTEPIGILVQTVPVDTTRPPRPPKDIMAVEAPGPDYLLWAIIAVAALLLIALVVWWIRRRNPAGPAPRQVRLGAAAAALAQLDALSAERLAEEGRYDPYFTRLTAILREYLKAAHRIPATEMTTGQILRRSTSDPLLRQHKGALEEVLITADPAKFGRAAPSLSAAQAAMQATRQLIHVTSTAATEKEVVKT